MSETERVREIWETKTADRYDRQMKTMDRIFFKGGREWLTSRARGKVLEIAIGTGLNIPFYSEDVRLTGVDFSPATLKYARERAAEAGREVELREADAHDLPFEGDTFDTVVASLCMCNFADPRRAVAELKRVLKPGGLLLSMDHVRSPSLPVRSVQRLINLYSVRFEGDHMLREPLDYYRANGLEIVEFERSKLGIVERVAARKPA